MQYLEKLAAAYLDVKDYSKADAAYKRLKLLMKAKSCRTLLDSAVPPLV
jgi:hypothetical protein